jgi:hypothetical protein
LVIMLDYAKSRRTTTAAWNRRTFLGGSVAMIAGLNRREARAAQESEPSLSPADAEEVAQIVKAARTAHLEGLGHSASAHFLGVGDAPDAFRQSALRHCEALGQAFLAHFRGKSFEIDYPKKRLTVITLRDADSYAAMLGEAPGKDVGGHYDLDTNRLVIFDFRPGGVDLAAGAERVNLFTLVHETAHQLCFNTGLLDRRGVVPDCISEGLATYVEMWRPGVRNAIGGINRPRLEALVQSEDWIAVGDLLAADKALFRDPATAQLAYAESWVLAYWLLRSRTRLPATRDYLAALKTLGKDAPPTRVAEKALGPLSKLDRDVKAEARRLVRE